MQNIKHSLRKTYFQLFTEYHTKTSKEDREADLKKISKNISIYLQQIHFDLDKNNVMAYEPFSSEIPVLDILNQNLCQNIYVPQIRGMGLFPRHIQIKKVIAMHQIDLIIAPALFVDRKGYRLGRGKGYYDRLIRFFDFHRIIFIGYSWQIKDSLPIQEFDRRLFTLITERGCKNCYH